MEGSKDRTKSLQFQKNITAKFIAKSKGYKYCCKIKRLAGSKEAPTN